MQSYGTPKLGVKVARVPTLAIGTKCHLDVGPMGSHRVYYKGEGDDFPQVQAVVNLMSPSLPMVHPSTKGVPTMH